MQEGKVYRFRADRIHRLNPAFVEKHGWLWFCVRLYEGGPHWRFKSVVTGMETVIADECFIRDMSEGD